MSGAILSLLSVLGFASLAAMEGRAAADPVKEVLPSGVRVVVLRDRSAPLVAARAVWSGGTGREPAELGGVTRLLAGAWTGGCGGRDPAAVERELADGASLIGLAGRDTLALAAEWPRIGWEQGFELLADCVLEPAFAPEAVSLARLRARALADERGHSPPWQAHQLLEEALFGAAASETALERADRGHIRALYRVHYPVSAMTLAVVGDVEPEQILVRARARFGAARRVRRPEVAGGTAQAPRERELYRRLPAGHTAAVAVGFLAVDRAHRDRAALEVAAALLDGPADAALIAGGTSGYLAVQRTCRPAELPAAHDALRAAVDRLRDPGPADADVRRAAARLARAREDSLARAPHAAALLALYEALGPGAEHAARHPARLRAVRAAEVRAAAERYLRPDRAAVATASPLVASPEAARRMRPVRKPARADRKPARRPERRRGRGRRR